VKTLRLTATLAGISLAAPATAPTLPGGVLPGPLFPQPGSGSLYPSNGSLFPNSSMPNQTGVPGFHRRHGFHGGTFIIYEDQPEVVHDVVVVHDPAPEPPPPPPPPRQRWVLGKNYSSLPGGGCMKMIEDAAAFFYCGGDWYQQIGRSQYKGVRAP
jgi:hypothetical protein